MRHACTPVLMLHCPYGWKLTVVAKDVGMYFFFQLSAWSCGRDHVGKQYGCYSYTCILTFFFSLAQAATIPDRWLVWQGKKVQRYLGRRHPIPTPGHDYDAFHMTGLNLKGQGGMECVLH